MQIEHEQEQMEVNSSLQLYLPGDLISDQPGFISGTNTYEESGKIYSNTTGTINQTNKLIMIKPIKSSYDPQIGEIVIGKVLVIRDKKWIIDINSSSESSLHLNSTYLPEQRQKTEDDEMNMRQLLQENDLICAEVHSINNDKSINLHTRSIKYGKLQNGSLLRVNHYLIVKQKRHFIKLSNNVHIILGHNGLIFLSNQDRITSNQLNFNNNYSIQQRLDITSTANAIQFLHSNQLKLSEKSIEIVMKELKLRNPTLQIIAAIQIEKNKPNLKD